LVVARDVIAVGRLQPAAAVAPAPDDFRSADKRVINRPLQRAPAECRVDAVNRRREIGVRRAAGTKLAVVAARDRKTQIDIARLADVLITAEMADRADVASLNRFEHVAAVAAKHLAGGLEEYPSVGYEPRHRDAGVADAVFAAHQISGDERPIGPRQHVVMERVDLAER